MEGTSWVVQVHLIGHGTWDRQDHTIDTMNTFLLFYPRRYTVVVDRLEGQMTAND